MHRAWTDPRKLPYLAGSNPLVHGRARVVVGIGISTSYVARPRSNFTPCTCRQQLAELVPAGHGSVVDTITTHTFGGRVCCRARDIRETCYAAVPLHACRYPREKGLAALRDTLLPKLISGELRVSGAGQHIERVA